MADIKAGYRQLACIIGATDIEVNVNRCPDFKKLPLRFRIGGVGGDVAADFTVTPIGTKGFVEALVHHPNKEDIQENMPSLIVDPEVATNIMHCLCMRQPEAPVHLRLCSSGSGVPDLVITPNVDDGKYFKAGVAKMAQDDKFALGWCLKLAFEDK